MELYLFDLYLEVSLKGGVWLNIGDLAYDYFSLSINTPTILLFIGIWVLVLFLRNHKEV